MVVGVEDAGAVEGSGVAVGGNDAEDNVAGSIYAENLCDDKRTNEIGLDFVRLLCVGQENKIVDGRVTCLGFSIEILFTDRGGCIK
uniref:Uncharacterized protein n=1 Tax=Romanomermis culicivorax TaxID=13658 RepID=A0A915L2C8_ROMCU